MFLYRIVYKLILHILFLLKQFLPAKVTATMKLRAAPYLIFRHTLSEKRIWVHYASGELEYIKPLLRLLKSEHPQMSIFATYYSPSASQPTENTKEIDAWCPLPWDLPSSYDHIFESIRPSVVLISRTDLWPEMLHQCKIRQIPSFLVAATFAEGSKKTAWISRWISKIALLKLNEIMVVSTDDLNRASSIVPSKNLRVMGDPRYDQVLYRRQTALPLNRDLTEWSKRSPLLVAGSTWPEDEMVLFDMLKHQDANLRLLLVPHEINEDHLIRIETQLDQLGISHNRFTHSIGNDPQVVIFDKMGLLSQLYQLSPIAFVGGSFKGQVHSVMEALGQGALVIVGPYHKNNREAIEWQKYKVATESMGESNGDSNAGKNTRKDKYSAVMSVASAQELTEVVSQLIKSKLATTQSQIKSHFMQHAGASQKILERIKPWL